MPTIAVVEDEPILRQLMVAELKRAKFAVIEAADGQSGWELIFKKRPDFVLLDLLMPRLSGYEVLTNIRTNPDKKFSRTPCLVISNSGQVDDLERAFQCGANDVLIKANFLPSQFVDRVQAILAQQG